MDPLSGKRGRDLEKQLLRVRLYGMRGIRKRVRLYGMRGIRKLLKTLKMQIKRSNNLFYV